MQMMTITPREIPMETKKMLLLEVDAKIPHAAAPPLPSPVDTKNFFRNINVPVLTENYTYYHFVQ